MLLYAYFLGLNFKSNYCIVIYIHTSFLDWHYRNNVSYPLSLKRGRFAKLKTKLMWTTGKRSHHCWCLGKRLLTRCNVLDSGWFWKMASGTHGWSTVIYAYSLI